MSWQELAPLLPLLILAGSAVAVLLSLCIGRSHLVTFALTVAALSAALARTWRQLADYQATLPPPGGPLLAMDGAGLYFTALLVAGTLAVAVMAYGYWQRLDQQREEFYLLLILACLGSAVLACAAHFAAFFLGLELLSVPLYALIAYRRGQSGAVEAGLKYLVLAGASSATLLLGMALVYYRAGTLGLYEPAMRALLTRPEDILATAGVALILAGAGFKLAAVPFHLWTPDVFEASPAPVTAFVATVSKAAVLATVLRFFQPALVGPCGTAAPSCAAPLQAALAGIAIASMFGGNLLALRQRNLKRLLAYSSIAHMGYMLVAFVGSSGAARAIAFYLPAYFVTTLAAFAVIAGLGGPHEMEMPSDYRGLARRRPFAAAALAAAMLSLAGIPLTAGFLGKFWVMYGGLQSGRALLVAALVVNSGIGLYYYLRVVIALYAAPTETTTAKATATASPRSAGGFNSNSQGNDEGIPSQREGLGRLQHPSYREEGVDPLPPNAAVPTAVHTPILTGLALIVLVALVVALGVYPGPLLAIIQRTFGP